MHALLLALALTAPPRAALTDEPDVTPSVAELEALLDVLEQRLEALEADARAPVPDAPAPDAPPPDAPAMVCLEATADFRPIHPTRLLPAGARELSVVVAAGATAGFGRITAVFVAEDVGPAAPPGTEMARSEQPASGSLPARFRYRQEVPLPAGGYRVDLLRDGTAWLALRFRVAAAPAAPPEPPSFPLEAGRRWDYALTQEAGAGARHVEGAERVESRVELRVAAAGPGPAHVEIRRDGELVTQEWWTLDERGLCAVRRRVADEELVLEPPQPLMSAAPGVDAWEYVNAELGFAQRCRQWGPVDLQGPWGRGRGYVVWMEQPEGGLVHTAEREFVPGVGLVRECITTARAGALVSRQELVLLGGSGR